MINVIKEFTIFAHNTYRENELIPREIEKLKEEIRREIKQLKARTKALRDYQRASRVTPKARFIAPSIRPAQAIISKEQEMLGQLFGHGDKFFGSKKMLPISGTPDEEGSETWRSFGI